MASFLILTVRVNRPIAIRQFILEISVWIFPRNDIKMAANQLATNTRLRSRSGRMGKGLYYVLRTDLEVYK